MNKKDLFVLFGISCFTGLFFLYALNGCFVSPLGRFIGNMGSIGLIVVPVVIGIMFYKKEVKNHAS